MIGAVEQRAPAEEKLGEVSTETVASARQAVLGAPRPR